MQLYFDPDAVWDINFSPDKHERHVKVNGVGLPCSLVSVTMGPDGLPVVILQFIPEHLHLKGFPEGTKTE